jgi:hypothetical protein
MRRMHKNIATEQPRRSRRCDCHLKSSRPAPASAAGADQPAQPEAEGLERQVLADVQLE